MQHGARNRGLSCRTTQTSGSSASGAHERGFGRVWEDVPPRLTQSPLSYPLRIPYHVPCSQSPVVRRCVVRRGAPVLVHIWTNPQPPHSTLRSCPISSISAHSSAIRPAYWTRRETIWVPDSRITAWQEGGIGGTREEMERGGCLGLPRPRPAFSILYSAAGTPLFLPSPSSIATSRSYTVPFYCSSCQAWNTCRPRCCSTWLPTLILLHGTSQTPAMYKQRCPKTGLQTNPRGSRERGDMGWPGRTELLTRLAAYLAIYPVPDA
ncbi:hypothetical protein LZ32DRAFT_427361 [Colletotrichum eremochloae]|nr:hypothetical protein LZ32DRAFT_427361 [Colletotrichum eremochloae]